MFDIFVLLSINLDFLLIVVFELMVCGKFVVGYCYGGVCEMVKEGKNGFFIILN